MTKLLNIPKDVILTHITSTLSFQDRLSLNATCTEFHSLFSEQVKSSFQKAKQIRAKYRPDFERFPRAKKDGYHNHGFEDERWCGSGTVFKGEVVFDIASLDYFRKVSAEDEGKDEGEFIDFTLACLYNNLFKYGNHHDSYYRGKGSEFFACMEFLWDNCKQWKTSDELYEQFCRQIPKLVLERDYVASIYPHSDEAKPLTTVFVMNVEEGSCTYEGDHWEDWGHNGWNESEERQRVDLMEEAKNPRWITCWLRR
jgi:hypothetical protein